MTSRAPPPALRRLLCGMLLAITLVVPFVLWILSARGSLTSQDSAIGLVRVWSVTCTLLMVWSAIYVEKEPDMARVSLALTALVFAVMAFQVHSFSDQSASVAAGSAESTTVEKIDKAAKTDKPRKVVKTGKIENDIVGKWQVTGHASSQEFLKDGTLVTNNGEGKMTFARYVFLDPKRFQVFVQKGFSKTPLLYADISVNADSLTMRKTTEEAAVTYQRTPTPDDPADLAGTWKSASGDQFIISAEGSFFFKNDYGTWNWTTGKQFVAKSLVENGSTWRLTLSSDGRTLSGTWSDPTNKSGNSTFTRRPQFEGLAQAIVGKWQRAGNVDGGEFHKDGTAVITNEQGEFISCQYSIPDSTHIQITKQGVKTPLWTVTDARQDLLSVSIEGTPAGTYLRVY